MNTIATTILEQLGRQFPMMTGARDFVALPCGIKFRIGRNASKANMIQITLGGDDLYTMEFLRAPAPMTPAKIIKMYEQGKNPDFNPQPTSLKTYSGLFFDQLTEVFTRHTGMATRLF